MYPCACQLILTEGELWQQDGRTALHLAAREGSLEVVKELVAAGCKIDAKDKVRG